MLDVGAGFGGDKGTGDPLVQLVGDHPLGGALEDVDKDVELFGLSLCSQLACLC